MEFPKLPSVGSSAIKCNLAKFRVRAAEVTFYSDLEKGTDIVDVGVNTPSEAGYPVRSILRHPPP